jgi:predicted TIM-barrel fold metal-dependent hydrolase
MDRGKLNLQVISHAPFNPTPEQAKNANDQLAKAVKEHPTRFAGFACLPMASPDEAAKELERSVKELGFLGALVDNHSNGTYYDDKRFWPIWAMAEKLDVPFYLHPTFPAQDIKEKLYTGNFSMGATMSIGASGWGWHQDCAMHVLRLYAAGVFDEFPKLKVVIGHFGEMIPMMLERIMHLSIRWGEKKRSFKDMWDENIWITTSGVWSVNPMATILRKTKLDHIMYSVDYPFADNGLGLKWMEDFEKSNMVSKEDLEAIAYKNAEKLLKIKLSI